MLAVWNTISSWKTDSARVTLFIDCILTGVISGFRREGAENCALLGYYATSSANFLPTFRDKLSVPSSGLKNSWTPRFLNPQDGTDRLSRNFGRKLPLLAAWQPRRVQFSLTSDRSAIAVRLEVSCHFTKTDVVDSAQLGRVDVLCRRTNVIGWILAPCVVLGVVRVKYHCPQCG